MDREPLERGALSPQGSPAPSPIRRAHPERTARFVRGPYESPSRKPFLPRSRELTKCWRHYASTSSIYWGLSLAVRHGPTVNSQANSSPVCLHTEALYTSWSRFATRGPCLTRKSLRQTEVGFWTTGNSGGRHGVFWGVAVRRTADYSNFRPAPSISVAGLVTVGSVSTLTRAGFPDAIALFRAGTISSSFVTSSP